jgi:hypothetical protein
MSLNLTPNIPDPDGFYDELLAAHEGLSKEESDAFNARLILTLANHVGDRAALREALDVARGPAGPLQSEAPAKE